MSSMEIRETAVVGAERVVVKVGSSLVTKETAEGPRVDTRLIGRLVKEIAALREGGTEVTLVSSGAVAAGCGALGLSKRPRDVAELQALAAIGQRRLVSQYHRAFEKVGLVAGQVLVTRGDFDDRERYLNVRNCITALHGMGAVPVLNENDPVAVDEIRFGDNDLLAAMACNALRAGVLLLLTSVDGLLDESGVVVDRVDDVVGVLSGLRRGGNHPGGGPRSPTVGFRGKSAWGSGGMKSKLEAARLVSEAGEVVVIANGREKGVIGRVLSGERLGTVVVPAARKLDSRSRWLGMTARPVGTVTLDDGAVQAVVKKGKSLLAAGVVQTTGAFAKGDVVMLRDKQGKEVARGLSNYGSEELALIKGRRTSEFERLLGQPGYGAVVHRDHMVVAGVSG
ncbi:MAG: glutamate 5-kinase [Planctomycetota bacterium]